MPNTKPSQQLNTPNLAMGGILLLLSLWFAAGHAAQPVTLIATAVAAASLSWKFPRFWLLATPIAFVAGDFYLDTGELLVQEREILIGGIIGGRLLNRDCEYWAPKSSFMRWLPFLGMLIIAGVHGFVVLPSALPGDALSTYASHHNPLRITLSYAVGGLLFPLAFRAFSGDQESRSESWKALSRGMQIGAAWVCLTSIFDRAVTVGLLDLDFVLRASGPFHSMHIGGQHIDAYWALAIPFVFQFQSKQSLETYLAWILQIASVYTIFVTMSRAIIAFAFASIIVLAILRIFAFNRQVETASSNAQTESKFPRVGIAVLLLVCGGLLWIAGSAVPGRFGRIGFAFETRTQHLQEVTELAYEKILFGYGLGTYSSVFRASIDRPQTPIGLVESDQGIAVRLHTMEKTYLEQRLDSSRPLPWTIDVKCLGDMEPGMSICHKSLLQSYDCVRPEKVGPKSSRKYVLRNLPNDVINSENIPEWRKYCRVTIGINASSRERGYLDIEEISIRDANADPVLKNGDFSRGSKHWFFSTDDHLVYHAKNLWSHIAIEMGMLGVLALAIPILLLSERLRRLAKRERSNYSLTIVTSMISFLAIGLFGTMLNTSWTIELVCLLVAVGEGLTHRVE
ncbi:MAG: hypothetical protein AAF394_02145 [Planctomycetota bacterium]